MAEEGNLSHVLAALRPEESKFSLASFRFGGIWTCRSFDVGVSVINASVCLLGL